MTLATRIGILRFWWAVAAAALVLVQAGGASAGVSYMDPVGGWRYKYDGTFTDLMNGLPPGFGDAGANSALDTTWQHNQADRWDGSGIDDTGPPPNGPAPGGVEAFVGGTSYIRMQDPGRPDLFGYDENLPAPTDSNRRINFGHRMDQDGALPSQLVLDQGITISFRARIPDTGPLDDIYTADAQNMPVILPWGSVGGGGYAIHDEGRGMFYVVQNDPGNFNMDSGIAFSLMTSADRALFAQASANPQLGAGTKGGLVMNNLAGGSPEPQIDTFDAGGLNLLEMEDADLRSFQEFWITIQDNGGAPGTHEVNVYLNGSTTPTTFNVTATSDGNTEYLNNAWLAMGLSASTLFGVVDVDFYSYSLGVLTPVPATPMPMPDLNMDGHVDIFDVNVVSANWGQMGAPGIAGDANKDGKVDIFDVNLISANWSPGPPPGEGGAAVPEPASWVLLAAGLAAVATASWCRRFH